MVSILTPEALRVSADDRAARLIAGGSGRIWRRRRGEDVAPPAVSESMSQVPVALRLLPERSSQDDAA